MFLFYPRSVVLQLRVGGGYPHSVVLYLRVSILFTWWVLLVTQVFFGRVSVILVTQVFLGHAEPQSLWSLSPLGWEAPIEGRPAAKGGYRGPPLTFASAEASLKSRGLRAAQAKPSAIGTRCIIHLWRRCPASAILLSSASKMQNSQTSAPLRAQNIPCV